MTVTKANGRCARYYIAGPFGDRFYLPVVYHRKIGNRVRPLTVSPKLMRKLGLENDERRR